MVYGETGVNAALIVTGAFLFGAAGAWFMSRCAVRLGFIDKPNERSSHRVPTPRGGGIGVVAVFLLAALYAQEYSFTILAGLIGLIGLLEDRSTLEPKVRLLLQVIISALVVIYFSGVPVSVSAIILFLLCTVFITGTANFYNFMDGINGIAGLTGAVGFALLSLFIYHETKESGFALICVIISMSCIGFLPYNVPRAKVFMGDVGSLFLGFLFASFVVKLSMSIAVFLCLIMFLSPFYADGLITIYSRWKKGEPLMEAHRSHLYQYLSNELQVPHWKVALLYALLQLIAGILALLAYRQGIVWQGALFALFGMLALAAYHVVKKRKPKLVLSR